MIITKSIPLRTVVSWLTNTTLYLLIYVVAVAMLYYFDLVNVGLPMVPVTLLGTAVAFYSGFKNNNSYDRMWEARKIWGSIVNNSRTWATELEGYITNTFNPELSPSELQGIKEKMVRRHIGWLYQLRRQLLEIQSWEHAAQKGFEGREANRFRKNFGIGLYQEEANEVTLDHYISPEELSAMQSQANQATQLLANQEKDLRAHRTNLVIDDFRHLALTDIIRLLYDDQGKCERIKKFPLPRQYAYFARMFTYIFIMLLPFTVMPTVYEAVDQSASASFISITLTLLVSWVYYMMDYVGDYSENPFQGIGNDIPMLSMSRSIEIDLLQIIGIEDTPPPIAAKNGILM